MSTSDKIRLLADEISELERSLEATERENETLLQENSEQQDRIFALQSAGIVAGLSEQAKNALLLVRRYFDEGDDFSSPRVQAAFHEAMDVTVKAAEIRAAAEAA